MELNVAVTDPELVTVHDPVPAQLPLHPVNTDPESALADKEILFPTVTWAVHVDPQFI